MIFRVFSYTLIRKVYMIISNPFSPQLIIYGLAYLQPSWEVTGHYNNWILKLSVDLGG